MTDILGICFFFFFLAFGDRSSNQTSLSKNRKNVFIQQTEKNQRSPALGAIGSGYLNDASGQLTLQLLAVSPCPGSVSTQASSFCKERWTPASLAPLGTTKESISLLISPAKYTHRPTSAVKDRLSSSVPTDCAWAGQAPQILKGAVN